MRVLLIKPSNLSDHIQPSLGLGYLATQIRGAHEVRIVDCVKEQRPGDQLRPILEEFRPDVVGSQCYSMDLPSLRDVLDAVRDWSRDVTTIVGGAHPTAAPEHTARFFGPERLDFVFVGEGELGFPKFLDALGNGRDFSEVPGLGWRSGGELKINPSAQVTELDELGLPAWDLMAPETYPFSPHGVVARGRPIAPIMATRGCPYLCTFCASAGTKLRTRSPESLLEEVTLLHERHGVREFHLVDDNFTLDMKYAKGVLEALESLPFRAHWATPNGVRLERLDAEILERMRAVGFYSIAVGVESGSERVRIAMKKGCKKKKVAKDLALVHSVGGIDVTGFFILGFPGETEADIRETIDFACELPLTRAAFHSFIPLPGTEVWRQMEASGELEKVDWERYFFWAGAYVPEGLERTTLRALHREAFRRFYLRPRVVLQNLKFILRPRVFFYGLKYLWKRIRPDWLGRGEASEAAT